MNRFIGSSLFAFALAGCSTGSGGTAPRSVASFADVLPSKPGFQVWSRTFLDREEAARGRSSVERGSVDASSFSFGRRGRGGQVGGGLVVFSTTPRGDGFSVWWRESYILDLGPLARCDESGAPSSFRALERWAAERLSENEDRRFAPAREGHCYLVYYIVSDSYSFGVFHVAELDEGRKAVLEQVGRVARVQD